MEQLARRPRRPWASLLPEVETSLQTTLSDSGDDVRYLAADALGDVRTAAVIQAIETRLAAETSPVVRSALPAAKNKLDLGASR
jgi:HEAT repeat protein